ncbi:MAG: dihydrodipicolinate synthase family protein [Symbiobacterium sp.]|uniref:dihydrodipicolinate synthase family protein n=1 Tax=Symbiobacterium sp. TaxID=1971213 RepID=UPI0034649C96
MSTSRFFGVYAILLTPTTSDERVDVPALKAETEHAIAGGVHGLVVLGSNGEGPLLEREEQEKAIAAVVAAARGRVPVLVGTGEPGTNLAVQSTLRAKRLGADGALLCPPFYIPMTQEQVIRHYETVVERCDFPIVLYNYPGVTKVKIELPTVERLAQDPRIVGIKDSGGDFAYHQALLAMERTEFTVFQSWEDFMHAALWSGSEGSMSPTPSLVPEYSVGLWNAIQEGDRTKALSIHRQLMAFVKLVTRDPWPAGWKAAMHLLGFGSPAVCAPNTALSPEKIEQLRKDMQALGILR